MTGGAASAASARPQTPPAVRRHSAAPASPQRRRATRRPCLARSQRRPPCRSGCSCGRAIGRATRGRLRGATRPRHPAAPSKASWPAAAWASALPTNSPAPSSTSPNRAQARPTNPTPWSALAIAVRADLERTANSGNTTAREIAEAHLALIDDPELVDGARALINQGKSAGYAWRAVLREGIDQLRALNDPRMAERADDLLDLETRVLSALSGTSRSRPQFPARNHPHSQRALTLATGRPGQHQTRRHMPRRRRCNLPRVNHRSRDGHPNDGCGGPRSPSCPNRNHRGPGRRGRLAIHRSPADARGPRPQPTRREAPAARRRTTSRSTRMPYCRRHAHRSVRQRRLRSRGSCSSPQRRRRLRIVANGISIPRTHRAPGRGRATPAIPADRNGAGRPSADHPHARHRGRQANSIPAATSRRKPCARFARRANEPLAAGSPAHPIARDSSRPAGRAVPDPAAR